MPQVKISDLDLITSVQDTDLIYVSYDIGGGSYVSKSISKINFFAEYVTKGSPNKYNLISGLHTYFSKKEIIVSKKKQSHCHSLKVV